MFENCGVLVADGGSRRWFKPSIRQKTNWEILKMENVEALTSPEEDNPYYPCVHATGFCIIAGVKIKGIALTKQ